MTDTTISEPFQIGQQNIEALSSKMSSSLTQRHSVPRTISSPIDGSKQFASQGLGAAPRRCRVQ
jgi:hypothetical protein